MAADVHFWSVEILRRNASCAKKVLIVDDLPCASETHAGAFSNTRGYQSYGPERSAAR
jgi:hypothetical protein